MRVPTDSEIDQAAAQLGLAQPLTPRQRTKVAKSLQLAVTMESDEAAADAASSDFAESVAATHARLLEAGLPERAAALVTAAIAPDVWRTTRGAAHAHQ